MVFHQKNMQICSNTGKYQLTAPRTKWLKFGKWPFRLKGYYCCLCLSVCKLNLVRMINSSQIWAWITKFAPTYILEYSQLVLKMGGHWRSFWPWRLFWLRILGNLACAHNNLEWIWSTITKFASLDSLGWYWKWHIDLDFQGHLAISTQNSRKHIQRGSCILS